MINMLVAFGGKSCEHDVSIITGLQFLSNVNKQKYRTFALYIDQECKWYSGEKLKGIECYKAFDASQSLPGVFAAIKKFSRYGF